MPRPKYKVHYGLQKYKTIDEAISNLILHCDCCDYWYYKEHIRRKCWDCSKYFCLECWASDGLKGEQCTGNLEKCSECFKENGCDSHGE